MIEIEPRKVVVVTRHKGMLDYLIKHNVVPKNMEVVVKTHIDDPRDIINHIVIGNIPLHLAAKAFQVWTVDMDIPPEKRGCELTLEEMEAFGALVNRYVVFDVEDIR